MKSKTHQRIIRQLIELEPAPVVSPRLLNFVLGDERYVDAASEDLARVEVQHVRNIRADLLELTPGLVAPGEVELL